MIKQIFENAYLIIPKREREREREIVFFILRLKIYREYITIHFPRSN